jgi:hypothetical protein
MRIVLRGKEIKFQKGRDGLGLRLDGEVSGFGFCVCVTSTEPSDAEWQQIIDATLKHDLKWLRLDCMPHSSTCVC